MLLTDLEDESMSKIAMQKGPRDYLIQGKTDSNLIVRAVCYAAERKQAEDTFKKTLDNFEELAAEQAKMQAQLIQAQKMDAVKKIVGGLTHDLNNLLTVIISCSSFLLEDLNKDNTLRQDIDQIKKAGERARFLVKQLWAFSSRHVIQPTVLNLNDVLVETERMLKRMIGENVKVEMNLDPALWPVKVDSAQMQQVIMNLAVNAGDAMPQGGKITIRTANEALNEKNTGKHISVRSGPYVALSVGDTGFGMNKKTQFRIFEPFFTTKKQGGGTGLGLFTVYDIVKQSKGDIRVCSAPGQGTIFKIYLPKAGNRSPPESPGRCINQKT
jgi:signal transduction histidine kinase